MTFLVPTLRNLLAVADAHFESGRFSAARTAFEELLERSQERVDHAMEVVARSMLARCQLRRRNPDAAREELALAARLIDPAHLESYARYRAVLARLAVAEEATEVATGELLSYLQWAEDRRCHENVVDACLLLAEQGDADGRLEWMRRALDEALDHGVEKPLGRAYNEFAVLLDSRERFDEALEAYQNALQWHRRLGSHRQIVASCWAVGAMACRLEDFPLARAHLDEAVTGAERADDCGDLLALSLADLALVYEAAGDVVEARRLLIRALHVAKEQDLGPLWPERWETMIRHAKRLEIET